MNLNHWKLERDGDDLAWATLDVADGAINTLGMAVLAELGELLDELERRPPAGLVIRSGKDAGFIAGARIEEFTRIGSPEAARVLVERGWNTFMRLASVTYPTLALIRGHCMGGGLELALACRYRLTVDEPGTRLSLPEVMLGIYPAWGGMRRLPALIGPAAALDLMLTGKAVDAVQARRLGLADDCVPARVMDNAARMVLLSGQPPRRPTFLQQLMNGPLAGVVAVKARRQVAAKASPGQYPAPFAIIDIWARHGGNALAVPAGSAASLAAIFRSPTARNLIRVFFLQERLKS
ncbi:enoyl-CoA hydratase-related protein, partial [Zoogloea sp.]|uniref:enoyl-CoA hydratase-related protein n=1 Tax=Zoogloea sp. TaxID=49181 RepID=UPI00260E3D8E